MARIRLFEYGPAAGMTGDMKADRTQQRVVTSIEPRRTGDEEYEGVETMRVGKESVTRRSRLKRQPVRGITPPGYHNPGQLEAEY